MTFSLAIESSINRLNDRFEDYLLEEDAVRGDDFEIEIKIENIEDREFPGGTLYNVSLYWVNTRTEFDEGIDIPPLEPGESQVVETWEVVAIETGRFGFDVAVRSETDEISNVELHDNNGDPLNGWADTYYVASREDLLIVERLEEL